MRKIISIFLALSIVFSFPLPTYAVDNSSEIEDFTEDDMIAHTVPIEKLAFLPGVELVVDESGEIQLNASSSNTIAPRASIEFEFFGFDKSVVVPDTAKYTITNGTLSKISIESCMWAPIENDVEIGFYNISTAVCTGKVYSGGSISNKSQSYRNLETGTYWVYAINWGETRLTSGIMRYTVS